MRHIQHFKESPDKILHIETEGCRVNVIIGTHDTSGTPFTTVEILAYQPDDDGNIWTTIGPSAVLVVPELVLEDIDSESSGHGLEANSV
jgi:hypothetical protein